MNNNKWLKLFRALYAQHAIPKECFVVSVWDDLPRRLDVHGFTKTFHETGIYDGYVSGGPVSFKEIRWIEFPGAWQVKRMMRDQTLEPMLLFQDLDEIEAAILGIGQLEISKDDKSLKIYGYK